MTIRPLRLMRSGRHHRGGAERPGPSIRWAAMLLAALAIVPIAGPTRSAAVAIREGSCVGDCNGDLSMSINELIVMVNMALGTFGLSIGLPADFNGD